MSPIPYCHAWYNWRWKTLIPLDFLGGEENQDLPTSAVLLS